MFGQELVEFGFQLEQLFGVDFDIGSLAAQAAADQGLVNHHAAVGQGEAFAFGAGGKQERAHAGGLAEAQGGYVGLDEVHGVVDRHAGRNRAAGAVDVEENIFIGVFAFQKQQLRHHQIGSLVVYRTHQEDNPLFQ